MITLCSPTDLGSLDSPQLEAISLPAKGVYCVPQKIMESGRIDLLDLNLARHLIAPQIHTILLSTLPVISLFDFYCHMH